MLLVDGKRVGDIPPAQPGETGRTVKVRWSQTGGEVGKIEAEINGHTIKADGKFSLAAPKIMFGARGRAPTEYETTFGALNVQQLVYSAK